ncbi:unannotated protein [freshwater metagenome]|uniref:Unannotated protein n=1 Tax=freshwater metagenome TaxID=449393 RepID=A0A6J7S4U6_9ZZZZ
MLRADLEDGLYVGLVGWVDDGVWSGDLVGPAHREQVWVTLPGGVDKARQMVGRHIGRAELAAQLCFHRARELALANPYVFAFWRRDTLRERPAESRLQPLDDVVGKITGVGVYSPSREPHLKRLCHGSPLGAGAPRLIVCAPPASSLGRQSGPILGVSVPA